MEKNFWDFLTLAENFDLRIQMKIRFFSSGLKASNLHQKGIVKKNRSCLKRKDNASNAPHGAQSSAGLRLNSFNLII